MKKLQQKVTSSLIFNLQRHSNARLCGQWFIATMSSLFGNRMVRRPHSSRSRWPYLRDAVAANAVVNADVCWSIANSLLSLESSYNSGLLLPAVVLVDNWISLLINLSKDLFWLIVQVYFSVLIKNSTTIGGVQSWCIMEVDWYRCKSYLSKPLDNRNLFKLFGVFRPDSFESRRLCILLLSQNVLIYHDDFKSMMILWHVNVIICYLLQFLPTLNNTVLLYPK